MRSKLGPCAYCAAVQFLFITLFITPHSLNSLFVFTSFHCAIYIFFYFNNSYHCSCRFGMSESRIYAAASNLHSRSIHTLVCKVMYSSVHIISNRLSVVWDPGVQEGPRCPGWSQESGMEPGVWEGPRSPGRTWASGRDTF